jgi:hypothetical protein
MRTVLAGLSGSGHRMNSPMRSRLAAISLGYKQPKTRPRVGIRQPVFLPGEFTLISFGRKIPRHFGLHVEFGGIPYKA